MNAIQFRKISHLEGNAILFATGFRRSTVSPLLDFSTSQDHYGPFINQFRTILNYV